MQIKEIIIESKIQNMYRLFPTVGNQEYVAFLTLFWTGGGGGKFVPTQLVF